MLFPPLLIYNAIDAIFLRNSAQSIRSYFGWLDCGTELECVLQLLLSPLIISTSYPDLRNLVTRIAATSNRKALAIAIAAQKNHCDSENTSNTAISLRFLREKLATSKL